VSDQPLDRALDAIQDEEDRLSLFERQAEATVDPETGEPGLDRGEATRLAGWHQQIAALVGGWPTFGSGGAAQLARQLLERMMQAGAAARAQLDRWRQQLRQQVARRRQLARRIDQLKKRIREIERAVERAAKIRGEIARLQAKRRLSTADRRRLARLRRDLAEQLRVMGGPRELNRLRNELELARREHEALGVSNTALAGEPDPRSSDPSQVAGESLIGSAGRGLENLAERAERVGDRLRPGGLETQWAAHKLAADEVLRNLADRARPAAPGADSRAQQVAELLQQELDQTRRQLAAVSAQFRALSGFAPLLAQFARPAGRFAHGGVVPETGMYLLHRDERVVPDPEGPYGSQLASPARPVDVTVVVSGDVGPLLDRVEVLVDGKLQQARVQQGRYVRLAR